MPAVQAAGEGRFELAAIAAALSGQYSMASGSKRRIRRRRLDTFDRRLRAAGLSLGHAGVTQVKRSKRAQRQGSRVAVPVTYQRWPEPADALRGPGRGRDGERGSHPGGYLGQEAAGAAPGAGQPGREDRGSGRARRTGFGFSGEARGPQVRVVTPYVRRRASVGPLCRVLRVGDRGPDGRRVRRQEILDQGEDERDPIRGAQ